MQLLKYCVESKGHTVMTAAATVNASPLCESILILHSLLELGADEKYSVEATALDSSKFARTSIGLS